MPIPGNHLIKLLPRKDRLHLLDHCESVSLGLSEVLYEPGQPTRHIYFPTDGFISLIAPIDGKPGLEVGIVGREGMLGVQVALGVPTAPLHALVQGPGTAWRIDTKVFRAELAGSAALQRGINRYVYVLMAQMATASACLRFHLIGQRLARWLLMSQDRAGSDSCPITRNSTGKPRSAEATRSRFLFAQVPTCSTLTTRPGSSSRRQHASFWPGTRSSCAENSGPSAQ